MNPEDIMVWHTIEGPISIEDVPYEDRPEAHDWEVYLVLKVSHKDFPEDMADWEVWFDTFDDAYYYKNRLDRSMEPLNLVGEKY